MTEHDTFVEGGICSAASEGKMEELNKKEINKLTNAVAASNPLQNIIIDPNLPTNTVMEDLNLGQQVNL